MSRTTHLQRITARKQHRCSWCGEEIAPGQTYSRYRYFDGADAATVKAHPECVVAMNDELMPGEEFIPYENERGAQPHDH